MAASPFAPVRNHILLPWASAIAEADSALRPMLNDEVFARIVDGIPGEWLAPDTEAATARRDGYITFLSRRLAAAANFVEEAIRARAALV
jgi:hypothetical protein